MIADAFPASTAAFSDSFIEENPNVFELDGTVELHVAVPAYMAWCARNGHKPWLLVHDYTVNALAELGRTKNRQITHLDFKRRCTAEQKNVVLDFLRWYLKLSPQDVALGNATAACLRFRTTNHRQGNSPC